MAGMGLCHEFGSQIRSGCDHPMRAGASACSCAECGVVCRGLFDGCPDVWARGPRPVAISATRAGSSAGGGAAAPSGAGAGSVATVTTIPSGRTEGARGVRAGSAVAAIGPAAAKADPANGAGGRTGSASGGADSGATTGGAAGAASDPRREVFKWFEEAFEGVRLELQTLIASMTHQQAMLAELLDSRQAELRLALVAESLPDIVADAVRTAMDDHTSSMAEAYERSHDHFRDDVDGVRAATEATVESLKESFGRLTSVISVHDEEAEQRETVRLGTLKGSVTRQITPLADALGRLSDKLDAIGARLDDAGRAGAVSAPAPAAAGRPARARTAAATTASVAAVPPARGAGRAAPSTPSAWAPQVAVGPVVARRVTSNRAAAAAADEEPTAAVPRAAAVRRPTGAVARSAGAPAKRAAAATRRRLPIPAAVEPEPEPEAEPEPEPEPAAVPARPRRISTPRATLSARSAAGGSPRPPTNGSNRPVSAPAPGLPRPPTARVTAPRASQPVLPGPNARPTVRRRPLADDLDELDEPVVTYELEDEASGLLDIDDGDDADWAPPAWVSEAAAKRGRGRPTR